ncbi:MAG: hypothetical protein ACLQIB_01025 [Isosphaeraceae bacterium]
MTHHDDDSTVPHPSPFGEEAADVFTGLSWPRTWPGLYLFVMGCLVAWVALLVVIERSFP